MLVAPTYPPATSFEQPLAVPYVLTLENAPLAELMSNADAWAIVLKHMPSLKLMVSTPMIKPHLGNMTVPSLSAFAPGATPEVFATIDEELSHLPALQGGAR